MTGRLRRTATPSIWAQGSGQRKPEPGASGQSGLYLPWSGKPVSFQGRPADPHQRALNWKR